MGLFAGCGDQHPSPRFALNKKTLELDKIAREPIVKALQENFGEPNRLIAWQKFPFDYGVADPKAADASRHEAGWRLKEGRELYMRHCLHCHGVSGDGDGPTARFLNPRPRDYRAGVFKFTSTLSGLKPSHDDLKRTLQNGIPGTTMPSFIVLEKGPGNEENLDLIVDYVRWLSARGELELKLVSELAAMGGRKSEIEQRVAEGKKGESSDTLESIMADLKKSIADGFADALQESASDLADSWARVEQPESVVRPKVKRTRPDQESIKRGRAIFLSKEAKCADCHGPAGLGNGSLTEDFWDIPNTNPVQKYKRPGLHDAWGEPQMPRNLTSGVYRGGRRPVDLYRRVFAGIKGTQMPAFGTVLNDAQIWDVVNYAMSLPFHGEQSPYPEEAPEAAPAKKVASSQH